MADVWLMLMVCDDVVVSNCRVVSHHPVTDRHPVDKRLRTEGRVLADTCLRMEGRHMPDSRVVSCQRRLTVRCASVVRHAAVVVGVVREVYRVAGEQRRFPLDWGVDGGGGEHEQDPG